MSANVSLNLLKQLGKCIKCEAVASILSLFATN